jgi:hypothetical protein
MADHREVTFFTGAHRRPLRFGELPTGERLPFNPTTEQLVAAVGALAVFGLAAILCDPLTGFVGKAFGFLVLPVLVYHVIGAVQSGGNAPAVAAYNAWHTLIGWLVHQLRRLERPERFDGKTRVWTDK